jgi:hypothetical protein
VGHVASPSQMEENSVTSEADAITAWTKIVDLDCN